MVMGTVQKWFPLWDIPQPFSSKFSTVYHRFEVDHPTWSTKVGAIFDFGTFFRAIIASFVASLWIIVELFFLVWWKILCVVQLSGIVWVKWHRLRVRVRELWNDACFLWNEEIWHWTIIREKTFISTHRDFSLIEEKQCQLGKSEGVKSW